MTQLHLAAILHGSPSAQPAMPNSAGLRGLCPGALFAAGWSLVGALFHRLQPVKNEPQGLTAVHTWLRLRPSTVMLTEALRTGFAPAQTQAQTPARTQARTQAQTPAQTPAQGPAQVNRHSLQRGQPVRVGA